MSARPLDGVSIIDLSRILAGPFATQLLADLGAAVHKIEPLDGDPTRSWGPPFESDARDTGVGDGSGDGPADATADGARGESAYFRCANRGKTTEAVDLHLESGRARVFELLAGATVVVENFLPASARRLGLDPVSLRTRFPHLIVASVRSFASDTAAKDSPGYDFLIQAGSGWMSLTGEPEGRPMKIGVALVDVLAGLYLANAIQAAVREKEQTGVARHVEVPLMEAALAGLVNVGAGALMTGSPPVRYGNAHPNIVPYQSFTALDGEVAVAVGNDRQFLALMVALGLESELAQNPAWRTNPGRVVARDRVVSAISAAIGARSVKDVLELCAAASVAAGPVRTVDEALIGQGGILHNAVHHLSEAAAPAGGEGAPARQVAVVGTPILFDGARACSDLAPPRRSSGEGEKPAAGR